MVPVVHQGLRVAGDTGEMKVVGETLGRGVLHRPAGTAGTEETTGTEECLPAESGGIKVHLVEGIAATKGKKGLLLMGEIAAAKDTRETVGNLEEFEVEWGKLGSWENLGKLAY